MGNDFDTRFSRFETGDLGSLWFQPRADFSACVESILEASLESYRQYVFTELDFSPHRLFLYLDSCYVSSKGLAQDSNAEECPSRNN